MADDLLERAITAARNGQKEEARLLLTHILQESPNNETAWLWMSAVRDSREERIRCLRQVLKINPSNQNAIKGLRSLGIEPSEVEEAVSDDPQVFVPPGTFVPMLNDAAVFKAQDAVRPILRQLEEQRALGVIDVKWAHPDMAKGGGQRLALPSLDIEIPGAALLAAIPRRTLLIGLGALAFVVLAVAGISFTTRAVRGARLDRIATAAALQATASTPTPSPTLTATRPPTRTPFPEGYVLLPEPTLTVGSAPRGNLEFGVTPSPPYIDTPHPTTRLAEAIYLYHIRQYQESIDLIRLVREQGDNSVDGYYYEGMALYAMGSLDEAAQVLQSGLAVDNNFAPLHAGLGLIFFEQGSFERAQAANERAKSLDPILVMPFLNQARLLAAQGDTEAALGEIEAARATGRNVYNVSLLVAEAQINLQMGNTERAAALANLAYYIDPTSEEVNVTLGQARMELGLYDNALIALEDFVTLVNPSSSEAWRLLAEIYDEQNRQADALQAYGRAIQVAPDPTSALIGRGLFYLEDNRFTLAYADLDAAIASRPESLDARLGRARAAIALGLYDEAVSDLAPVRVAAPGVAVIETLYVQALVESGRYPETIDTADAALSIALDDIQRGAILEARGRAYFQQGQNDLALQDIQASLSLQDTGTRHYYRGLILKELGQIDAAILDLEWIVFWDSVFGYPFTDNARQQLEELYRLREVRDAPTPTPSPSPTVTPTRPPLPAGTPGPTQTPG